MKNYNDLQYVCSCVEGVARVLKQKPTWVFQSVDNNYWKHFYEFADVNHCLPLDQVVSEIIEDNQLSVGGYDTFVLYKGSVPPVTRLGSTLAKLVMGINSESVIQSLTCLYSSELMLDIICYDSAMWYASTEEKLDLMCEDGTLDENRCPIKE